MTRDDWRLTSERVAPLHIGPCEPCEKARAYIVAMHDYIDLLSRHCGASCPRCNPELAEQPPAPRLTDPLPSV